MKLYSSIFRFSRFRELLLILAVMLLGSAPRAVAQAQAESKASVVQTPAVPTRITQAIDESQLVRIQSNVHPLARPEFDKGPVDDSMPVTRAFLLLQRSPEQEAALEKLLDDQQTKDSPRFHQWLTPQQFGAQFGPSDSDIQTLTGWLTQQGFHDVKVAPGRTLIEFSGTVGQVRSAFHTDIHKLSVHGEAHLANMNDPQVPAALSSVISGIRGLHDFRPKPLFHRAENFHPDKAVLISKTPFVTLGCGTNGATPCYGVAPPDFAKIYNVPATVGGNPAGQGVTIAVVEDSNINVSDVQQFRTLFGLPSNFTSANVILNGPDPGVQGPTSLSFDEGEADLDVEWSGAVAPGATVDLVVSENPATLGMNGVDLSADYVIENNIAAILSESFGDCESSVTAGFFTPMWQQAAAEGITVSVSTGDSGSDVCDGGANDATTGLSVSGTAATQYNVALGGTDFQNGPPPSIYWSSPGTTTESAKSYIPESPWNSSCAAGATPSTLNTVCTSATPANLEGGSGGQSTQTARPSWQVGITPSADAHRDLPDISLYSAVNSSSNTFYLMCEADSPSTGGQGGKACSLSSTTFAITTAGGTSFAAPAFAGIMAIVIQQQGGQRQGNASHVLYNLYRKNIGNATTICASNAANVATTGCIFYDVITGNNSVACAGGSPNCSNSTTGAFGVLVDPASTTTPAFTAVAGYDKATGLGSVNVGNLVTNWSSGALLGDSTTFTSSPTGTIAHGNNASFTIQVAQSSGTTVPTGTVTLIATSSPTGETLAIGTENNGTTCCVLSSSGTVTIQTNQLPGGTDSIVAQYGGDGTFAPSQSAPVSLTVAPETSKTAVALELSTGPATTTPYGSNYVLRVDVTNTAGQMCSTTAVPCPTGKVTLTDNGAPLNDFNGTNTGSLVTGLGFLEDQPVQLTGGAHSIVATYAGDASYSGSTSPTLAVTITTATTTSAVAASPSTGVTATTPVTLTATITSSSNSTAGPTGNVTFKDGSTTLGTAAAVPAGATATAGASATAALSNQTFAAGTHSITVVYPGDQNYATSTSGATTLTVGGGGTTATTTALGASPMSLPAGGGSVALTAMVTSTGTGASPSGTVQFNNGTTALGAAQTCTAVAGASVPTCKATLTTTLSFLAPPLGPQRLPKLRVPPILLVGLALLLVMLLAVNRVPARYRRVYACAGLLLLAGLVAGLATGCGGGYGGGGGGVHYDYVTAAYSGDATYAGSTSAQVTITVQ